MSSRSATKALQEAGPSLTREKLLDLIIAAPNEARLKAYVSLARTGMDYIFFQTLTERIDKANGRGAEEARGAARAAALTRERRRQAVGGALQAGAETRSTGSWPKRTLPRPPRRTWKPSPRTPSISFRPCTGRHPRRTTTPRWASCRR